jgi:hypothetical protein
LLRTSIISTRQVNDLEKSQIRFEPLWPILYLMGFLFIISSIIAVKFQVFSLLMIVVAGTIPLILLHYKYSKTILAEISFEGIRIFKNGQETLLKWQEIIAWEYRASGSIYKNVLIISTKNNKHRLEGFRYIKIINFMRQLAPDKERKATFTEYVFILVIIGAIIVLWLVLK